MTKHRKLRISHLVIQPILVWDDGEELTPGPEIANINVPLSMLSEPFIAVESLVFSKLTVA